LAVLCILLTAGHDVPKLQKAFFWIMAIAVCCSTITVGQHYFMDVPGGIITAIFAFYAARRLLSRTRQKKEEPLSNGS
jgi:membrane-associated phospholipid phosphatase